MSAMPWVGALMALVACGGGESLTYDESIDSISSAMARTMAAEFSIESRSVYIVETADSIEEYTYSTYQFNIESAQSFFGYEEDRNPFAPPVTRHSVTLEDKYYEFVDSSQCYSYNPRVIYMDGGGGTFGTFGSYKRELYRDYDYSGRKWVAEDGSSVTLIEFESDPDTRFSFKVENGFLVEQVFYSESDTYGILVGDDHDGKIVAKRDVTRYYDIGVKKDFPVLEPICE